MKTLVLTTKINKKVVAIVKEERGFFVAIWEGKENQYKEKGALSKNFKRSLNISTYEDVEKLHRHNVQLNMNNDKVVIHKYL